MARWMEAGQSDIGLSRSLQENPDLSLSQAYQRLPRPKQNALEERLGRSAIDEILSLSVERDPQDLLEALYGFAGRAGILPQVAPAFATRARERLDAMRGQGNFGTRAEYWLSGSNFDQVAGGISHTGAVLGLATIFCSYLRPLRPLAAGGIHLLSHPTVAGTLLASGGYLLARQAPEVWAAGGRLLTGDYQNGRHSTFEDGLFVSGWALGALGVGVGAASFGLGARTYLMSREAALAQGFSRSEANTVAYMRGDAVRRAIQDPEIWVQYARSQTGLAGWQRLLLSRGGQWTSHGLLYGSAAVGLGKFGLGVRHYLSGNQGEGQPPSISSLFLALAMDVSPAVSVQLYRAGRGNRNFNLGPALSQELTEAHYQDPALRELVLRRVDQGLPKLSPAAERAFIRQGNNDLLLVERLLRAAQELSPLPKSSLRRANGQEAFQGENLEAPQALPAVRFQEGAHHLSLEQGAEIARYNLSRLREVYGSGEVSPTGLLSAIFQHPVVQNGAIFPRPIDRGPLRAHLERLAAESDRRFENGTARPLEGVFVAVKDLFPDVDGVMQMGSKTGRVVGVDASPAVTTLLDYGAIPIPVGMVAAANGGSGMNAHFGYIPHPRRPGLDVGGSSSGTAHVVGLEDFPIVVGEGTSTGGSIQDPALKVGLPSIVPPSGVISTKNMVPFSTRLDRVGVMAVHMEDAMSLARYLSRSVGDDPHVRWQNPGGLFQAAATRPRIVYLESLVKAATTERREHFQRQMQGYREQGYEVTALGPEWDFVAEAPLRMYPFDAYAEAAFAYTNPLRRRAMEVPLRSLDENLLVRLPKGAISIRLGFYDQTRRLSRQYQELVRSKLGEDSVVAFPSVENVPTADLFAGRAGNLLDGSDRITMAVNRIPEWGQITVPNADPALAEIGMAFSGRLPNLMHFSSEKPRSIPLPGPELPTPPARASLPIFMPHLAGDPGKGRAHRPQVISAAPQLD
ncbi:MAG: hypothetical protein K8R69_05145 [Deltaproteobacteria bacterium]|nr:hypothetical protein [Deltaproteobacteria bacterium]